MCYPTHISGSFKETLVSTGNLPPWAPGLQWPCQSAAPFSPAFLHVQTQSQVLRQSNDLIHVLSWSCTEYWAVCSQAAKVKPGKGIERIKFEDSTRPHFGFVNQFLKGLGKKLKAYKSVSAHDPNLFLCFKRLCYTTK